jgi:hypothetical protein
MNAGASRPRTALAAEIGVFVAVAAFAAAFAHFHLALNGVHPQTSLERLCAYTAETPYQHRVLMPSILRGLELAGVLRAFGATLEDGARALDVVLVVALFYAMRTLLARFVPGPSQPTLWAALALYALPFLYVVPRYWAYWYTWDVPAVLFTTLGVLWIRERRWAAYYWLLPLATLNRETTAFLVAVFALTQFGELKPASYLLHLATQAAIWLGIVGLIQYTFARNEGLGFFFSGALKYNWSLSGEGGRWATLALVYGCLWIPLALLARHVDDAFVRRALPVVPVYFAIAYCMAQFDEVRIYGEMLPLVILGLACGARGWRAQRAERRTRELRPTAPSVP